MGGLISVIIGVLAAIAFYGTGHLLLFWMCVVIIVLSFWSWGVMHNYAMKSAKARWDRIRDNMIREGRSAEEIDRLDSTPIHPSTADVNAVPDWLATVNMLVTFAGIGLLIWGIIVRFF
jgi:small-conductance mechanosensitive channel